MDELLFIGDPDGKYDGSNFLICMSVAAFNEQWAVSLSFSPTIYLMSVDLS